MFRVFAFVITKLVRYTDRMFDVAIIGSGISGSTLAAILAKEGLKVVILESREHPRFTIGESMILETSEIMRAIGQYFEVSEIENFSSTVFKNKITNSHGIKKHFTFFQHFEDQEIDSDTVLQAIIPKEPYGHELHLYRQDADYHMLQTAIEYGAEYHSKYVVNGVEFKKESVEIVSEKGEKIVCKYVVDSAFFGSPIRKKFNLTSKETKTQARGLYTHMMDIDLLNGGLQSKEKLGVPDHVSEGTLHHVFEGGWLWVIPFNNTKNSANHVVSVGLMLDPEKFPFNKDIAPEDEFFDFIQRFPTIARQFKDAKVIRDWVRTPGPIQFTSKQVVDSQWALLGNTAGFIDPLYSKGLYVSMVSVFMLGHKIIESYHGDSLGGDKYIEYQSVVQNYLQANDDLVAQSYKSFESEKHWKTMAPMWLLGAYNEYVKLICNRAFSQTRSEYYERLLPMRMVGGGFEEFNKLERKFYSFLNQGKLEEARHLFEKESWIPVVFKNLFNGVNHLPKNKLTLRLFNPDQGFMKTGLYRVWFFDDKSILDVVFFFISEKIKSLFKS